MMPDELPKEWKVSDPEAIRDAVSMQMTKHGIYAAIPILCQGDQCPYAATCPLLAEGRAPIGERCPLEIAKILKGYEEYKNEFGIDEDNVVDMTLIKDLIDIDVQIYRADKRLAIDGDFLQDYVVAVNDNGDEVTNKEMHKATDYKDRLLKKKHSTLQLMHGTRKDKAGDKLTVQLDPSSYASRLMQEMNGRKDVIDAEDGEFKELDDDQ